MKYYSIKIQSENNCFELLDIFESYTKAMEQAEELCNKMEFTKNNQFEIIIKKTNV